MKNIFLTLLAFCFLESLLAQNDSSLLLSPALMTDTQIVRFKLIPPAPVFLSATRYPDTLEQLPFTAYVVTAAEILSNGYVTLADVLKSVPGIRVSQPGNTLEGETFMMRGLLGNEYVKILINDVPVKPSVAPGMPIGAQLPIRQAERIEILYGPASAVYGADACAGVINIILKESERPLFTQADLAFGLLGYNSLDLTFGGKVGLGKKIFRFSLYGSSTVREETDVFYDGGLYDPNNYLAFGQNTSLYEKSPNYRASPTGELPNSGDMSHESRLFGGQLKWRGIQFSFQRMSRFEHTALGLNPLAIALGNRSNRYIERMQTFSMVFRSRFGRLRTNNTLSVQTFRVENSSSSVPVFDRLLSTEYHLGLPYAATTGAQDTLYRNTINRYATNERYMSANGLDARYENRFQVPLSKNWSLDVGWLIHYGAGEALVRYLRAPYAPTLDTVKPFSPYEDFRWDGNAFTQLGWQTRRWTVMAGLNVNGFDQLLVAPRVAALFRLDSTWNFRASFSTGYRQPSFFAGANTFFFKKGQPTQSGTVVDARLREEQVNSMEVGFRFSKKKLRVDGVAFMQKAYYLLRDGYFISDPYWPGVDRLGFANAPGLAQSLMGVQAAFTHKTLDINTPLNDLNIVYGDRRLRVGWYNTWNVQFSKGKEFFGYNVPDLDAVRNLPNWITQFRTNIRVNKFEMTLTNNRQSSWIGSTAMYKDAFQRTITSDRISKFKTWDWMTRWHLSDHFLVYLHFQNLWNKRYGGIDATGTPDDLLWNPQMGRTWRFGINYNMN